MYINETFSFGNRRFISKHQVSLDFTVLTDGTPPAPIVFKREKEQQEESFNDILCKEPAKSNSDDEDSTNYSSSPERVFTGSSGILLKSIT